MKKQILLSMVILSIVFSTAAFAADVTLDATDVDTQMRIYGNSYIPPGTTASYDLAAGTYRADSAPGGVIGYFDVDEYSTVTYNSTLEGTVFTGTGTNTLKILGHPITIDLTDIDHVQIFLQSLDVVDGIETYNLPVTSVVAYNFLSSACGKFLRSSFGVASDGTVFYDASNDGVTVNGLGTDTLTVIGYPINIDIGNVDNPVSINSGTLTLTEQINPLSFPMDCAGPYKFYTGEALRHDYTAFTFDGSFVDYDSSLDGVTLNGLGTDTVQIIGYPITYDATAISTALYVYGALSYMDAGTTVTVNLAPVGQRDYLVQPKGAGHITSGGFDLDLDGNVVYDEALDGVVFEGLGTSTIKPIGKLVTIYTNDVSLPVSLNLIGAFDLGSTVELYLAPDGFYDYKFVVAGQYVGDFKVNQDGTCNQTEFQTDYGTIYITCGVVDTDDDGVEDELDNCPNDYNPGQEDSDLFESCESATPTLNTENSPNPPTLVYDHLAGEGNGAYRMDIACFNYLGDEYCDLTGNPGQLLIYDVDDRSKEINENGAELWWSFLSPSNLGVGGSENLDLILVRGFHPDPGVGFLKATLYTPSSMRDIVVEGMVQVYGFEVDAVFQDVFIANGAGNDYTFNPPVQTSDCNHNDQLTCEADLGCSWDIISDSFGDACDNCVNDYNPDQLDQDNDGIGDVCDEPEDNNAPTFTNPTTTNQNPEVSEEVTLGITINDESQLSEVLFSWFENDIWNTETVSVPTTQNNFYDGFEDPIDIYNKSFWYIFELEDVQLNTEDYTDGLSSIQMGPAQFIDNDWQNVVLDSHPNANIYPQDYLSKDGTCIEVDSRILNHGDSFSDLLNIGYEGAGNMIYYAIGSYSPLSSDQMVAVELVNDNPTISTSKSIDNNWHQLKIAFFPDEVNLLIDNQMVSSYSPLFQLNDSNRENIVLSVGHVGLEDANLTSLWDAFKICDCTKENPVCPEQTQSDNKLIYSDSFNGPNGYDEGFWRYYSEQLADDGEDPGHWRDESVFIEGDSSLALNYSYKSQWMIADASSLENIGLSPAGNCFVVQMSVDEVNLGECALEFYISNLTNSAYFQDGPTESVIGHVAFILGEPEVLLRDYNTTGENLYIAGYAPGIIGNEWHEYKICVFEDRIMGFLDGYNYANSSYTFSSPSDVNFVGVGKSSDNGANCIAYIDEFKICAATKENPTCPTESNLPLTVTITKTMPDQDTFQYHWFATDAYGNEGMSDIFSLDIQNILDSDGDGIFDDIDNCVTIYNPDQLDQDNDGIGDVCDICPFDPENDIDGDGLCADVDPCPGDPDNDADNDTYCVGPYNPNSNCTGSGDGDDNDPEINPGAPEVCDGKDNDQDGIIDNGGNSLCNDGLFCNGQEICGGVLLCQSGTPIVCSANNLAAITTCNNNPDNNPFTWDYFVGFTSTCNEDADVCTTGTVSLTNSCDVAQCGAECAQNNDCTTTECDNLDSCYDGTYRDYQDTENTCITDCSCTTNECGSYTESITDLDEDSFDTECDSDCNDNDAQVYPGAPESYDGKDNDCNGETDEVGLDEIRDAIYALPDYAFKNNPDNRKKTFSNKLDSVMQMIDDGDYLVAIDILVDDIRAKADGSLGGNPNNDWITDPAAQQEIVALVDNLVAYLETQL